MNELAQVSSGALAPSDYATYALAKQNDGIIGGSDIAQIRSYAAYARAQAEAIHKVIANANSVDDIGVIKDEAMETASTYSRVSIFADMRIGELLKELPKAKNQHDKSSSVIADKLKTHVIKDVGIDRQTASDLQRLADHPDVVEQVIAEADERGEIVSRNKVLKAIKEQEQPKVRTCRKCGCELTDENSPVKSKGLCKKCSLDVLRAWEHPTIENEQPEWTVEKLISELEVNAPTWRNTAMQTFGIYAECGVVASQKSIDAINRAFDGLDAAIAAIVEG